MSTNIAILRKEQDNPRSIQIKDTEKYHDFILFTILILLQIQITKNYTALKKWVHTLKFIA